MPIPEFREFFLRTTQVNSGAKPDKETGFPLQYQTTDCDGNVIDVYNRFLKGHVPSEAVFKKLMESIAFKLNPEDTANSTNVGHGLVRIAIGSQIVGKLDTENGFTTVVVPSELPRVLAGNNVTVDLSIRKVSDNTSVALITPGDRGLYYLAYTVNAVAQIDNVKSTVMHVVDTATVDENVLTDDGTDTTLHTATILGGTLTSNGDHIQYEMSVDKSTSGAGTAALALFTKFGVTPSNSFAGVGGAGLDATLAEAAYHVHVKMNIYRTSATTAKVIGTIKYYTRPNVSFGEAFNSVVLIADQADTYFTYNVTTDIDWADDMKLQLMINTVASGVNEAEPYLINQFLKAIVD
jgi:hypothetical protein